MNILLVDDDRFIIKALQETIHWEALGIEQVYTASSPVSYTHLDVYKRQL